MTKKKIILITTKGCEGCKIMENLINKAILQLNNNSIVFNKYDKDEIKNLCKEFNVNDFPTTLIFEDYDFKVKLVGTKPVNKIVENLD